MIFLRRWDRSSLAFSSVTAPKAPFRPPFIAGGARGGAEAGAAVPVPIPAPVAVAERHLSSDDAASERSAEGSGAEVEEAETARRTAARGRARRRDGRRRRRPVVGLGRAGCRCGLGIGLAWGRVGWKAARDDAMGGGAETRGGLVVAPDALCRRGALSKEEVIFFFELKEAVICSLRRLFYQGCVWWGSVVAVAAVTAAVPVKQILWRS